MTTEKRAAVLSLALLILTISGTVNAGPLKEGLAAYESEDYTTALELLRPQAEQGNAEAQCILGKMYGHGEGVQQDYVEAVEWYRMAAEQGHADAQAALGFCYQSGQGVKADYAEAAKWCRLAAEQGHAYAQGRLGWLYKYGSPDNRAFERDYAEAVKWLRLAAEQGVPTAQYSLGEMYAQGLGVQQDFVKAHLYYNLASQMEYLQPRAVKARDGVASVMTPAQLAEAQRLAREWKPK